MSRILSDDILEVMRRIRKYTRPRKRLGYLRKLYIVRK